MNLFDLLLALVILSSVVAGFRTGFARAAIGFLAVIAGVLIGFWFYYVPAGWVHYVVNDATVCNVAGFLIVFVGTLIAGGIVGTILSKFFKWTGLSFFDRIFGAGFGFIRGVMMITALIAILMAFIPTPPPTWMVGSTVLPYAIEASDFITGLAPRGVKDAFRASLNEIRKEWDEQIRRAQQYREKIGKSKLKAVEQ